MLVFILIAAAVMIATEVPKLAKANRHKDLIVFLGFVAVAVGLGIILVFRLPLPNPTSIIEAIFKPVTEAFFGKE